jgi:hypothetical protein
MTDSGHNLLVAWSAQLLEKTQLGRRKCGDQFLIRRRFYARIPLEESPEQCAFFLVLNLTGRSVTDEHYGIERTAAFDLGWDGNSVKGDSYASTGWGRPQHFRMFAERNRAGTVLSIPAVAMIQVVHNRKIAANLSLLQIPLWWKL